MRPSARSAHERSLALVGILRVVTVSVLLVDHQGTKEFVEACHVHGVRDGHLLLASGVPGGGLDAEVIREVDLGDIAYVETVTKAPDSSRDGEAGWSVTW